jgi:uncharacterized membrane protein YbaN (DUF454 family)
MLVFQRIAAYSCLVVGVAGIVLPVLPGIPLLFVGLKLLGPDHPITRPVLKFVRKFKRKYSSEPSHEVASQETKGANPPD